MKNKINRVLSIIICIALVVSIIPLNTVLAIDSDVQSGGTQFEGKIGEVGAKVF